MKTMLKNAAQISTKMRNPDLYTFKCEVMGSIMVIVNCYGHGARFSDCLGYAYDLGIAVEEILNAQFPMPGKTWVLHSEENYWDADGEEIHPSEEEYCDGGACAQWVIFAEEE